MIIIITKLKYSFNTQKRKQTTKNYDSRNKRHWRIKARQLTQIFNIVCHNFQCDIVQKAYVKIHLN